MNLSFIIQSALRAISHHKGRSLLTILGIVIGIAGIIATTAIGSGAQKKTREQLLAYGSHSIAFSRGNWLAQGVTKKPKYFTEEDITNIRQQNSKIEFISPILRTHQSHIEYEGKPYSANIRGMYPEGFAINEHKLALGILYTQNHEDRKANVVVLDAATADAMFKWKNPVGETIRMHGIPFTVIGVLEEPKVKGRWDIGQLFVYVPFATGQKYFSKGGRSLDQIVMSTYDIKDNDAVIRQTVRTLRAAHNLKKGEPNDFLYFDRHGMADAAESGSKIIGLFALIAASIALLVGGIGVMNIMLVAVQERTKEIGIKLALGATRKIILRQFLIESIVLCSTGGFLGIIIGLAISHGIAQFTSLPAIVEVMPMLVAFMITVLIGIFFGFYPARKASLLKPVEALTEY